jgi:hypothetical protein
MYTVNYKNVDKFVSQQRELGVDVEWDGWTLVFHRPEANAVYTKQGVFHNGEWGYANRFEVNEDGNYYIDSRNLRRPRHSRR